MSDLERELRSVLSEDASSAPPAADLHDTLRRTRRRQAKVVGTAVLATVILVLGVAAGAASVFRSAELTPNEPATQPLSVVPAEWIRARDAEWVRYTDAEHGFRLEIPDTFVLESPSEAGPEGVLAARDPVTGDLYTVTVGEVPAWWWSPPGLFQAATARQSRAIIDKAAAPLIQQGWTDVRGGPGGGFMFMRGPSGNWWLSITLSGIAPNGEAGGVHSSMYVHDERAYTLSVPVHYGPDSDSSFPGPSGPIYARMLSSLRFT